MARKRQTTARNGAANRIAAALALKNQRQQEEALQRDFGLNPAQLMGRVAVLDRDLTDTGMGAELGLTLRSMTDSGITLAKWQVSESKILGVSNPGAISVRRIPKYKAHQSRMALIHPYLQQGLRAQYALHRLHGIPVGEALKKAIPNYQPPSLDDPAREMHARKVAASGITTAAALATTHVFWMNQQTAQQRWNQGWQHVAHEQDLVLLANPAVVLFSEPLPLGDLTDDIGQLTFARLVEQCDNRQLEDSQRKITSRPMDAPRSPLGIRKGESESWLTPLDPEAFFLVGIRYHQLRDNGEFAATALALDGKSANMYCVPVPRFDLLAPALQRLAPTIDAQRARILGRSGFNEPNTSGLRHDSLDDIRHESHQPTPEPPPPSGRRGRRTRPETVDGENIDDYATLRPVHVMDDKGVHTELTVKGKRATKNTNFADAHTRTAHISERTISPNDLGRLGIRLGFTPLEGYVYKRTMAVGPTVVRAVEKPTPEVLRELLIAANKLFIPEKRTSTGLQLTGGEVVARCFHDSGFLLDEFIAGTVPQDFRFTAKEAGVDEPEVGPVADPEDSSTGLSLSLDMEGD